ncbi:hypothetical protein CAPTEDRAFT_191305 [Capitella teleta]|uniref:Uncharacterized protein n=1 Tax=Capitella teleta TaxID=283909 RepID=R7U7D8_CAPTE|nr:hypothetical protein CAPTEDRAFT_191305 [Capitella teleta]|eukprot:ELU01879.1 hypothetical protein CAPTEDRAFT_191305 [Capitella teleta]
MEDLILDGVKSSPRAFVVSEVLQNESRLQLDITTDTFASMPMVESLTSTTTVMKWEEYPRLTTTMTDEEEEFVQNAEADKLDLTQFSSEAGSSTMITDGTEQGWWQWICTTSYDYAKWGLDLGSLALNSTWYAACSLASRPVVFVRRLANLVNEFNLNWSARGKNWDAYGGINYKRPEENQADDPQIQDLVNALAEVGISDGDQDVPQASGSSAPEVAGPGNPAEKKNN